MATYDITANLELIGRESLTTAEVPDTRTIRYSFSKKDEINATSTPSVDQPPLTKKITLAGSIVTLDLSAAEVITGRTNDMTGNKLVAFGFAADPANTGDVTVAPGATNGYNIWKSANSIDIVPGLAIVGRVFGIASGYDAVAAADLNIDISGTSGDKIDVTLWFG